jgi:MFS family permease
MIALLLLVMSLLYMLSYFKFQTMLTKLISNRLSATSPAIYESIESAIDLGLGLGEIRNTERVISWVQQKNPGILSIDIFNNNGTILYSTEKKRVKQSVAPQIFEILKTSEGHIFQSEADESFLSIFKLLNSYNQRVGGGLITYSKNDYNSQVMNFRNSLFLKTALGFIAFSIIASIAIMAAFRGLNKYLQSIETSHDKIRDSVATGENVCFIDTKGLPAEASEDALIRMDAFDDRLCLIERNIAAAASALGTLKMPEPDQSGDEITGQNDISQDRKSGLASKMARPLILVMIGTLFVASIIFAYMSLVEFNRFLAPELKKKAQLIALNIKQDIARAVDFGIPFEKLVAVDEYLDLIANEFDEVNYIDVQDRSGRTLFQGGQLKGDIFKLKTSEKSPDTERRLNDARHQANSLNYSYPIEIDDKNIGSIDVGIDENFVRNQLHSIIYDNIVILLIAILIAFQIMTALFLYYVIGPIDRLNLLINLQVRGNFSKYIKIRGGDSVGKIARYLSQSAKKLNAQFREKRDQIKALSSETLGRIDHIGKRYGLLLSESPTPLIRASVSDIRMPLFLFAFAEELQKSFLPIYIRQLYQPIPWLNESVVISLPIVVWLLIVGLAAPFTGHWSKRFGSRNIFLFGLIPSGLGFLGCSMAHTILEVILWRGATGLGYAMITIACQDYLLGRNVAGSRNVNIAVFIGIVITATMCGTAIGGILAARIGYRPTFLIAVGLIFLAGFTGYQMLNQDTGTEIEIVEKKNGGLKGVQMIFKNPRFIVFLFCIAIPTNILMAAYLWYLVPLYLFDLGATTAQIGRTMLVYYLLIITVGGAVPKKVTTTNGLTLLVGLGSLISGIGLIAFYQWPNFWAVVLAVVFLGLSHALIKAPQITLSLEICKAEVQAAGHNAVLGSLRLLERFGGIIGLITGAVLISHYGYQYTTGIAGAGVCAASLIFLLFFFMTRNIDTYES